MPRRAAPGRRALLEGELGDELLAAIDELARLAGFAPGTWPFIPALARVFGVAAVLRLSERLQAAGATKERALAVAAATLGLEPESVARLARAWRRESRAALAGRALSPGSVPAPGVHST